MGALCSIDQNLPEQASRLGIPVATADYRALVERDDLDADATPTPTHREIMLAAVAAGKHVLCEKPLAMNLREAGEMQAAAEVAGVTAMIDFEFRFSPTRRHVQQLLADGYVGDLRHATIELLTESPVVGPDLTLSWHDQAALGGGALLSDAPVRGGKIGAARLDELPRPASLPALADAPSWRVAVVQRLIREFERGIRDGGSPAPSFQDGLRCQAILDTVRESARDGRRVQVTPV